MLTRAQAAPPGETVFSSISPPTTANCGVLTSNSNFSGFTAPNTHGSSYLSNEKLSVSDTPVSAPPPSLTRPSRQAAVSANLKLGYTQATAPASPAMDISDLSPQKDVAAPESLAMDISISSPQQEVTVSESSAMDISDTPTEQARETESIDPISMNHVTLIDPRDTLITKLLAEVASLKQVIVSLSAKVDSHDQILKPASRSITSYLDTLTTPSKKVKLPELPRPSISIAALTSPTTSFPIIATKATQDLDQFSSSQLRRCLSTPPAPIGLRIVHIDGYRHMRLQSPGIFASIMEVKFRFPRKYIINVSVVTERLVEVTIDASSLDQLKAALSVDNCPLTLFTDLNVTVPISDHISNDEAKIIFSKRIAKEVTRLKLSKYPLLIRVADLLTAYAQNSTIRTSIPRSRPTPTYMSAFLPMDIDSPAEASSVPNSSAPMIL